MADVRDGLAVMQQQVATNGISMLRVDDGHVMVVTTEVLRRLLAAAEASGKAEVVVFVKHGPAAGAPELTC